MSGVNLSPLPLRERVRVRGYLNSEVGGRDTVSEAWGAEADAKASEDKVYCSCCALSPHKTALTVIRGVPAAGNFLLRRQKKVTKENATPVRRPFDKLRVPCVPHPNRALRNSRYALRHCSLHFPRFGFVTWRLTGDTKNLNRQKLFRLWH